MQQTLDHQHQHKASTKEVVSVVYKVAPAQLTVKRTPNHKTSIKEDSAADSKKIVT